SLIEQLIKRLAAEAAIVVPVAGSVDLEKGCRIAVITIPAPACDHELAKLEIFLVELGVSRSQFDAHAQMLLPVRFQRQRHPAIALRVGGPEQIDNRKWFAAFVFDQAVLIAVDPACAGQFSLGALQVVSQALGAFVSQY